MKKPSPSRDWLLLEFQSLDYPSGLELQRSLVDRRKSGELDRDVLLLLEHPPVFTLGRSGSLDNLLMSPEALRERSIEVARVERGGDITYHGPGQLIAYPVIDLRKARMSMTDLVTSLEEVMMSTAADFGVQADRSRTGRGVWVGPRKLGSLGLALRRGITFHGLALNVNLDLTPFSWINPCGLSGVTMTSLALETGSPIHPDLVRQRLKVHFQSIFRRVPVETSLEALLSCMNVPADIRAAVRTEP
jgi:lipoate-protein ligase B